MIIPSGQAFAALRAAHPTAVLVATSAENGAISAGTSSVKQQFAETGSLGEINWGKVALDTGLGGFVGGTTGALGSGISNYATTWLSKSATISSLLNSESAVTRVATNFAIGSVAEVGGGIGTRFVGGMLTSGGDFKEAGMQAINPQNIFFDAALGGAIQGV